MTTDELVERWWFWALCACGGFVGLGWVIGTGTWSLLPLAVLLAWCGTVGTCSRIARDRHLHVARRRWLP